MPHKVRLVITDIVLLLNGHQDIYILMVPEKPIFLIFSELLSLGKLLTMMLIVAMLKLSILIEYMILEN